MMVFLTKITHVEQGLLAIFKHIFSRTRLLWSFLMLCLFSIINIDSHNGNILKSTKKKNTLVYTQKLVLIVQICCQIGE